MAVMTAEPTGSPQPLRALDRANEVRVAASVAKRELFAGVLSVSDALEDERAGVLTVFELLCAQRQWGRARARKVLVPHMISEGKKVRELTVRQRGLIRMSLGGEV